MLRNGIFAVNAVSIYLLVYVILLQIEPIAAFFMLLLSPVLVCWMVYNVLKHEKYTGRELGDDEFGYEDKVKGELGVF